eukprot:12968163-Alexandrium_andersonii.AAC.1
MGSMPFLAKGNSMQQATGVPYLSFGGRGQIWQQNGSSANARPQLNAVPVGLARRSGRHRPRCSEPQEWPECR